jgi:gas vesicle protein
VNKYARFMMRTALNLMDDYANQLDRASDRVTDRVSDLMDRGRDLVDRGRAIVSPPDHTLRNVLSFAAGVGVGIGAGLLLAPSSGTELRQSIKDRVQGVREMRAAG